jgi:hypothetical protein
MGRVGYTGSGRDNIRLGDLGILFYTPPAAPTTVTLPHAAVPSPFTFRPPSVAGPVALAPPANVPVTPSYLPAPTPPGSPDSPATPMQQLLSPQGSLAPGGPDVTDGQTDAVPAPAAGPAPIQPMILLGVGALALLLWPRKGRR